MSIVISGSTYNHPGAHPTSRQPDIAAYGRNNKPDKDVKGKLLHQFLSFEQFEALGHTIMLK